MVLAPKKKHIDQQKRTDNTPRVNELTTKEAEWTMEKKQSLY